VRVAVVGSPKFDEVLYLREELDKMLRKDPDMIIGTSDDPGACKAAISWAAKRGVIVHLYKAEDSNGPLLMSRMRDQKIVMGTQRVVYFMHEGQSKNDIEFPTNFAKGMGRPVEFL